jgi:DNA-binding MarR family transcriptional regulator
MTAADRPFLEMEGCACFALRRASRALTQFYDRALRPHGLRATQLPLLVAARKGPLPLGPMAEGLGMDRTTLLRNLRPLVRRGLIAQGIEEGTRKTILELTAAGRTLLLRAYPAWKKAQAQVLSWIGSPAAARTLAALGEAARRAAG